MSLPGPNEPVGRLPDLRIIVPALAAWLAAFVGVAVPAPAAATGTVAMSVAAAGVLFWWRRPGLAAQNHRAALVVVASLVCAAGAAGTAAARTAALSSGPLPALARERAAVTAFVVLTSDPARLMPRVRGSDLRPATVIARGRLETLTARGRNLRMRRPVLLFTTGSDWMGLLPGQRLRITGRLGPRRPGDDVAAVITVRGPPKLAKRPGLEQRSAGRLREGLRESVKSLPEPQRALIPGLVVGDTAAMPTGLIDDFRTAGLTHLVAVSGANLIIVLGFLLYVGRWLGVRGRGTPILGVLAVIGFVILARPQPSVLRAAVMGLIGVAALSTGRRRASLPAVGAAVLVLVLIDPWLARSYGFALSVLATSGLVLLAGPWTDRLATWLPRPLAAAIAAPAAAQLACTPVVAMLSAQVSLVAIPANFLVAPAVAPATVLGVLAAGAAPLAAPIASIFGWLSGAPAWWIVAVGTRAAEVPYAAIGWPGGVAGGIGLVGLLALVILARPWFMRRRRLIAGAVVGVLVLSAALAARPGWPPTEWVLVACDVGQGDALVLDAGNGTAVVVDAGPDPRAVDRCLRDLGVRRIALLLLTHMHADHVEGLPGVLRRRRVSELQVGPLTEPREEYARVTRWAARAGLELVPARVGEERAVGDLRWRVLWPHRVIRGEGSVPNNASVVLLAERVGVRVLLTGDAEPAAQRAMLRAFAEVPVVDVLKVAHHGSAYQAPELLAATRPRVAIVSVGAENDYGHPATQTLRALDRMGAAVLRTDRDGDVAVVGRGDVLRVVRRAG